MLQDYGCLTHCPAILQRSGSSPRHSPQHRFQSRCAFHLQLLEDSLAPDGHDTLSSRRLFTHKQTDKPKSPTEPWEISCGASSKGTPRPGTIFFLAPNSPTTHPNIAPLVTHLSALLRGRTLTYHSTSFLCRLRVRIPPRPSHSPWTSQLSINKYATG